jgi:hypothetical protein
MVMAVSQSKENKMLTLSLGMIVVALVLCGAAEVRTWKEQDKNLRLQEECNKLVEVFLFSEDKTLLSYEDRLRFLPEHIQKFLPAKKEVPQELTVDMLLDKLEQEDIYIEKMEFTGGSSWYHLSKYELEFGGQNGTTLFVSGNRNRVCPFVLTNEQQRRAERAFK